MCMPLGVPNLLQAQHLGQGPNLAAVNALFALSNCFNSDDVMSDLIRAE